MTAPQIIKSASVQTCQVFLAEDFPVTLGANMGDSAECGDTATPGDLYALVRTASPLQLCYSADATARDGSAGASLSVAEGSDLAQPGALIRPLGRMMLMADDGATLELMLLQMGETTVIRPLSALQHGREYTLISTDRAASDIELAEMACVSFTRGTHITLSNGAQRRVEELKVCDRVLTRDHGPQQVRWIGQQTTRAIGAYAPVVISEGALNNAADLILSPDHRLFIYQRQDAIGAGQAEVLVRARHLVNDDTIYQREGGFVEYFHLLFDEHEIIYAEGIPAESLMVTSHTLAALTDDMAREVKHRFPDEAQRQHHGIEAQPETLIGLDAAEVLRRASRG